MPKMKEQLKMSGFPYYSYYMWPIILTVMYKCASCLYMCPSFVHDQNEQCLGFMKTANENNKMLVPKLHLHVGKYDMCPNYELAFYFESP